MCLLLHTLSIQHTYIVQAKNLGWYVSVLMWRINGDVHNRKYGELEMFLGYIFSVA